MLFNGLPFAIFFLVVLALHRLLPRRARILLLLAASLVFYTLWLPAYVLLLVGDIVVNYLLLRWLVRSPRPRLVLAAAVTFSLGVLAFFKYAAFLVGALHPILGGFLRLQIEVPEILLPLGISFFSFQIIALSVDAYRGQLARVPRFHEYALFVCFFPQLIAGPILRGGQLLPQLRQGGTVTGSRSRRGLWLVAGGLVKKIVFADFLLAPFVDAAFAAPGELSTAAAWAAVYSFAFQIYFDFSGYTDIARGIALLLGFELPLNFREPYLSRSPAEFWTRWHVTLSQWLRDYLYVPLGGNRFGSLLTYRNLMLTMLIGGLWHGAAWTFVAWGGLHGLLLVGQRLLGRRTRDAGEVVRWRDAPRILALFHAVCVLWVFFRAEDFGVAWTFLGRLVAAEGGSWPGLQLAIVATCALAHVVERALRVRAAELRERLAGTPGALLEGASLGAAFGLALALGGAGGAFIYFQF